MSGQGSAANQPGPTSEVSSTAISTADLDQAHDSLVGLLDKFTAPNASLDDKGREELGKTYTSYKTLRQDYTTKKAEADKKAEEAAKNYTPPDYAKNLKMPEGTKLSEKHKAQVIEFAKATKLPLESAQAILDRDNEVLSAHQAGLEQEFKTYNEQSVATLKKDWGTDFEANVGKASAVVNFYEKSFPGFKKEIERLGISSSTTANKFFLKLFEDLKMSPDTIEHAGGGAVTGGSPLQRTDAEKGRKLFSKGFSAAKK